MVLPVVTYPPLVNVADVVNAPAMPTVPELANVTLFAVLAPLISKLL